MIEDAKAGAATALVVIDMQNSFLHPEGGNFFEQSKPVVPKIQGLLDQARETGQTIIHVAEQHRPGIDDFEGMKLPEHCVAGSDDAAFFEGFGPQGGNEFLLPKRRVSAFFATDLDLLLRERNVGKLVITGVKTNVCVRATVIDGFSLGYRCHVVDGAVASNRQNLSDAALEDIDRYFGWVVSVDEAMEMLA